MSNKKSISNEKKEATQDKYFKLDLSHWTTFSVTRRWWCNNVVWWWSEFGHDGWRVEKMVLIRYYYLCVRWVKNIFKIQNEDKIMQICSIIFICLCGAGIRGFWNSKKLKKKSRLTKMASNWISINFLGCPIL